MSRYVIRAKAMRDRLGTAVGRIEENLEKRHSMSRVMCDVRGDFVLDLVGEDSERKMVERELARVVQLEGMADPDPMKTQCGVCEEELDRVEINIGVALRGRPARAGIGVVFRSPRGELLGSLSRALGPMGEPSAAYQALILGLEGAVSWGPREKMTLILKGDSPSLSQHLTTRSLPKHYRVLALHRRVENMLLESWEWQWVSVGEEENAEARKLAKEAARIHAT